MTIDDPKPTKVKCSVEQPYRGGRDHLRHIVGPTALLFRECPQRAPRGQERSLTFVDVDEHAVGGKPRVRQLIEEHALETLKITHHRCWCSEGGVVGNEVSHAETVRPLNVSDTRSRRTGC